jgi:ABC-type transport system involved in multi-copper enzyme maturation permease subunit
VSGTVAIAAYALRESTRRRVFAVVLVLTAAFLALYAVGAEAAFDSIDAQAAGAAFDVDDQVLTGSTLLGLAMFTTLFLGCVLAVFLTLSAVRGDAERGVLQPLVVRPLGRTALLGGRFAAAAGVCAVYVAAVYGSAMAITGIAGGWWPADPVGPGIALVAGVILIAALSLLGSIFLSATANGIAIFMTFGAGLAAGLLGQIGDALNVDTLQNVAKVASWALPFEALYQGGLDSLTQDVGGTTAVIVQLGPFGGAQQGGPLLWAWSVAYLAVVAACARLAFARRDL